VTGPDSHDAGNGSGESFAALSSGESHGLRIAYADPPYIGQAKLYRDHPDYAGEVDHRALLRDLAQHYDGWVLHTSSTALPQLLRYVDELSLCDYRIMAWVKPFAAFKRNVSVAYAWEPVLVMAARKPVVKKDMGFTYRDWLAESITLKRGLTGAKPEKVVHWLLEAVGAEPGDEFADLYPGTGAVTRAWNSWATLRLEAVA
jgi:hypothetical protein